MVIGDTAQMEGKLVVALLRMMELTAVLSMQLLLSSGWWEKRTIDRKLYLAFAAVVMVIWKSRVRAWAVLALRE